jgi:predicted DNA-binding transcriptional regulator YafY
MKEFERLIQYRNLLSHRRAISKADLLQQLEISLATFKRDLTVLRDRCHMPVIFDRDLNGYRLEFAEGHTELPGLWFNQEEILALLTIQHMIGQLEPGVLGPKLRPLQNRLTEILATQGTQAGVLTERVKLLHAGKRTLHLKPFQIVAQATLARQQLSIDHFNRQTGETLRRTISPQQLVHYRDNWYVDAWCHLRNALRNFAIDAIQNCQLLEAPAKDIPLHDIQAEVNKGYGIFSGQEVQWAELRFTPQRARWVEREQWHPEQQATHDAQGNYLLKVPYSDPRELLGDILRHGPEVQVIGPPALRQQVQRAIAQALKQYDSYQ